MNADGSGQRKLTRNAGTTRSCLVARRAEDRLQPRRPADSDQIYVMNADGSGQRRLTHLAAAQLGSCLVARRARSPS